MSTKTNNPLVRMTWEAASSAHNATNLAHSCFADLGTLFHAIADASESRMTALRDALGFPPIESKGGAA